MPPPVWGSGHLLCRSSWLSLGARRLRQLMELRVVCRRRRRRSHRSKVPAFGRGPGAGDQDPPLKGAREAGRDAQRPWRRARHLSYLGGTPHLNQKEAEKSWLTTSSKDLFQGVTPQGWAGLLLPRNVDSSPCAHWERMPPTVFQLLVTVV